VEVPVVEVTAETGARVTAQSLSLTRPSGFLPKFYKVSVIDNMMSIDEKLSSHESKFNKKG
jgi:hypothetical protein